MVSLLCAYAQAGVLGVSSGKDAGKKSMPFAIKQIINGKWIIAFVNGTGKGMVSKERLAVQVAFDTWLPRISELAGKKVKNVKINFDLSPDLVADINVYFYPLAKVQKKCEGMAGCYKKQKYNLEVHNIYVPKLDLGTVSEDGKEIKVQDILTREVGHFLEVNKKTTTQKAEPSQKVKGKKQTMRTFAA